MAVIIPSAIVLGILSLVGVVVYRIKFSSVSHVPGPFLARFSILWQLWHVWKGDYHDAIRAAHRKYGPLVRVSWEEVSVCNDEAASKILYAPLDKGSWYRIFAMPDSSFKNQMSELKAERFAVVQRKIARGYAMSSMVKMEDRFDRAVSLFLKGVDAAVKRSSTGAVSLCDWFTYYSFDIVGLVTFSREFGFLKTGEDVGGCIATSNALTIYIALMAYFPDVHDTLNMLLSPVMRMLGLQPMLHVMQTTEQALATREAADQAGNDMVAHWKNSGKTDDPLSARDLFATANANVAAGGDTVGTIEQAFVYYMLKRRECVDRLQAELDLAAEEGRLSSPVSYSETLQLPYFQACMKEVLRYHPVTPTGFVRIAPATGLVLSGKYFPAGTAVSVNAWAMHHDPLLFGEDAHLFKPERWLEPGSKALERNYIPFGGGYMTCPGRNLGTMEMSKLLTTMFLEWDLRLERPDRSWSIRGTILVKGENWRVVIKDRKHPPVPAPTVRNATDVDA